MRTKKNHLRYAVRGFITRYLPMVTWISLILYIFWTTYYNFKTQPQYFYLRKILGVWLCISRGAAPVITLCSLGALFAACRSLHSLLHQLLAHISTTVLAQIQSRITYTHTVCAITLIVFSMIHSGAHIMNAINFSKHYFYLYPEINVAKYKGENPAYLICTWTGCSGIAMLLILLLIAFTSRSKFRKKYYNRFYLIHHLFVVYFVLLLTHTFRGVLKEQYNVNEHKPGCIIQNKTFIERNSTNENVFCESLPHFRCISTQNWFWTIFALVIYLTELLSRKCARNKYEAIQFCNTPGKAVHVKIRVSNDFKVQPGQYILLQSSEISNLEWHPFTVTQCPTKEQQNFDVLISVRGDWTAKLYNFALNPYTYNNSTNYILMKQIAPLNFCVNGPFASPMQSIKNNKIAVCVAAGIGITAYIATVRTLIDDISPNKIHLLWITRDPQQIMWYSKLLSNILKQLWLKNQPDKLLLQLHITKDINKTYLANLFEDDLILSRIHHGRPNWKEEFRLWSNMYKKKNVPIYCCGPNTLRKTLNKYCNKMKKKGHNFNFIYEGF